jgi:FkbM family methyltransferase
MKKIIIKILQTISENIQIKGFPKFILLIKNKLFSSNTVYKAYNNVNLKIFPNVGFHCLNILNHGGFDTIKIFEKYLNLGDTFIDIGANLGYMSINASKIVGPKGKIISFEPDNTIYNLLENNISLNNVENIKLNKIGLSNYNGEASFNIATESGLSRLENKNNNLEGLILQTKITIKVKTLDSFLSENNFTNLKIKMIKIDVEGHELNILQGAINLLKDSKPIIILEINPGALIQNDLSLTNIVNFLDPLDYDSFFINSHSADIIKFSRNPSFKIITPTNIKELSSKNFDLLAIPKKFEF